MLMGGHLEVILWGSSGASSASHRSKEQTVGPAAADHLVMACMGWTIYAS